jgi:hypothetical protein
MAPVLVIKGKCLYDLVNEAFIDDYPREDKTSRDNPRKKVEKPLANRPSSTPQKQQQKHSKQLQNAA